MNPLLLISIFAGGSMVMGGLSQRQAYKAQAKQAEMGAREQEIERRKRLNKTLAMQNVMSAVQGRTVGSISHLQEADITSAEEEIGRTYTMARAGGLEMKRAGTAAMFSGLLGGAGQIAAGAYQAGQTATPGTAGTMTKTASGSVGILK